MVGFKNEEMQMRSVAHNCCSGAGKMREGRHDFMARVEDEIIVIKDVTVLVCDTCGGVEYTSEVSRGIDRIRKEFFAGRLRARPLAAKGVVFKTHRTETIA